MGQNFDKDHAHGMKMEEEAVKYLQEKFPGAIVKRYTYEEDRELQKKGIDLVVSHKGRRFSVQVKSRKAGSQDLCFEGHWENGTWVMDWPEADYYLYYVPDFQEEPILFDVNLFAMQHDCNPKTFVTKIFQNKDDRKSCAYVPPMKVVRQSRDLHGWTQASKIEKRQGEQILPKINKCSPILSRKKKQRNVNKEWGLQGFCSKRLLGGIC